MLDRPNWIAFLALRTLNRDVKILFGSVQKIIEFHLVKNHQMAMLLFSKLLADISPLIFFCHERHN